MLATLPPSDDFKLVPGPTGDNETDSAVMVCSDESVAIGLLRPGAPMTQEQLQAFRGAELASVLVWAAPQHRSAPASEPESFDGPSLVALTEAVREAAVINLPGERKMADCASIIHRWQSAALSRRPPQASTATYVVLTVVEEVGPQPPSRAIKWLTHLDSNLPIDVPLWRVKADAQVRTRRGVYARNGA